MEIRVHRPTRKHAYDTRTEMIRNALENIKTTSDAILIDSQSDLRLIRRVLASSRLKHLKIHQRKRTTGGWLIFFDNE